MKYYENKSRFNGVYSSDNLSKIKDGTYIINLDEYSDISTHWVALWVNNNNVTYFDSFGVEHIPKEIIKFIKNRNIKTNIFRMQAYDSIIDIFELDLLILWLKVKVWLIISIFFSPNDFERNDDTILNYFMNNT